MKKNRQSVALPVGAVTWKRMLQAIPVRNRAAELEWAPDRQKVKITVARKRPKYLVPPISWILKPRPKATMELDRLGTGIWEHCDGKKSVEEIVDEFAKAHGLTFHESRASVTGYLQMLIQRGILAVAMREKEAPL